MTALQFIGILVFALFLDLWLAVKKQGDEHDDQ